MEGLLQCLQSFHACGLSSCRGSSCNWDDCGFHGRWGPGKPSALFLRQELLVLGVKLPKKIGHLVFQGGLLFVLLAHFSKTQLFNFWVIHKMVPQKSLTFYFKGVWRGELVMDDG